MPKQIQNPLVGQALQYLFGLQGRVEPSLDEIVVPTVQIGDLSRGGPPGITRSASAAFSQAAGGAGQFSVARFEVPGNVVARIDSMVVRVSGAAATLIITHGSTFATPANTAQKSLKDGRLLQAGEVAAGVVTYGTQGVTPFAPTTSERYFLASNALVTIPTPGLIVGSGLPGQFGFMEFGLITPNLQLDATIQWTEFRLV